jgi:hypothetical protein
MTHSQRDALAGTFATPNTSSAQHNMHLKYGVLEQQ